ncbi:MAG: type II secretion system protein [Eubacteriales bacterium]|nr:type II secretion system protein [Eubacteriales bacterium]
MNIAKDQKAFTVLELMFVILIISILLSGVSPYFFKSFADARKTTDEANLKILNTAVSFLKHTEAKEYESFRLLIGNDEKLTFLREKNYIDNIPEIQSKDSMFLWVMNLEQWIIADKESYSEGDFFLLEKNSNILFPLKEESYNVKVVLNGGGVLIDYTMEADSNSYQGYILHFDESNRGALVLREISDNKPGKTLVGYTFNYYNSFIIPANDSATGKEWWDSHHEISIIVNENNILSVYMDNDLLFGDFKLSTKSENSKIYTGIWSGDKKVIVNKIDISY